MDIQSVMNQLPLYAYTIMDNKIFNKVTAVHFLFKQKLVQTSIVFLGSTCDISHFTSSAIILQTKRKN